MPDKKQQSRDWIRAEDGFKAFRCDRCGDRYATGLPCPLPMMLAMMKSYEKMHKDCKEANSKSQSE